MLKGKSFMKIDMVWWSTHVGELVLDDVGA